jgi:hypothetical protein
MKAIRKLLNISRSNGSSMYLSNKKITLHEENNFKYIPKYLQ